MNKFDVVIVGAGIAGISTAYYLATKHQITNVLLVDKRPPLTFTSDKSGSNYRNWWSNPAMVQLANHSIDKMDELAQKTHNIFNMNRRGYAYFGRDVDMEAYLNRYSQADVGDVRIYEGTASSYQPQETPSLSGADVLVGHDLVKQYAPFVADDVQSMVHVRRAGWISTRVMAHHMLDTAAGLGVAELLGAIVEVDGGDGEWHLQIDTYHGVQSVSTPRVVWAVGPNTAMLSDDMHISVSNVFHQKLMIRDRGEILPDGMPFMIFTDAPTCDWTDAEREYLVDYVGSDDIPGNFHIRRVNDDWIHLGWAFNNKPTVDGYALQFETLFPDVVVKGMSSFIPALKSYVPASPKIISGGFYTRTPENLPIIHADSTGRYVITALSGFGVMMGCGIGDIMSDMVAGYDTPAYVNAFSSDRYQDADYMAHIQQFDSGEL